jgi:hypothetical protein
MSPIDDELRRALERHADDVPPLPDPVAGAESRAGRIRRQRRGLAAVTTTLAVVAIAIVVPLMRAGDGKPADVFTPSPAPATSAATPTSTPASKPSASATASPPAVGSAVAVYYLGDPGGGLRLYREWHKTTSPDRIRAAVEMMLHAPLDSDYTTLWPAGTTVRGVAVEGEVATVDLSGEALKGTGTGSGAACWTLKQLVWTVTAADTSIHQVMLTVNGRPDGIVSRWWGVGCGRDVPMVRETSSLSDSTAPVQISSHNEGDTTRGNRFSFGGEASVFEATVSWSVVDANGTTLLEGHDNASVGAPERGSWQANVVLPGVKAGQHVELRAWETSMKDGSVTNLDTKKVVIGR